MNRRIPAGRAHYAGDVAGDIVGQVVGPTTAGVFLLAVNAEYDVELDRTTVEFVVPSDDDMRAAGRDEHGFVHIAMVDES